MGAKGHAKPGARGKGTTGTTGNADPRDESKTGHTVMFTRELWRKLSIRAAALDRDRSDLIAEWVEDRLRRYRPDPVVDELADPVESPAPTAPVAGVVTPDAPPAEPGQGRGGAAA